MLTLLLPMLFPLVFCPLVLLTLLPPTPPGTLPLAALPPGGARRDNNFLRGWPPRGNSRKIFPETILRPREDLRILGKNHLIFIAKLLSRSFRPKP